MRLDNIKISSIVTNRWPRSRKELGDIQELAQDIKINGLISPIAVVGKEPPYMLAAGGRRIEAMKVLKWEEAPCNVYDHDLTELELRSIELAENIARKDLTYREEINLKREIHNLQQEILGASLSGPGEEGHSLRDTAALLGKKSPSHVAEDIRLANAIDQFPELEWDKCKTKKEATNLLNRIKETFIQREISARAEEVLGPKTQKLVDCYYVGDFFDHVDTLPAGAFDLVEIDPPYGIDLPKLKLKRADTQGGDKFLIRYGETYNEIAADQYEEFAETVATKLYRVMNNRSWIIWWFAPDPWLETIYNILIKTGFQTRRLHAIWTKPGGQVHNPDIHLAHVYEDFFYARKGDAVINFNKRGRGDDFRYTPIHPSKKAHPTERPMDLMEEILSVFGWEGARIYVPFCGSGNTLRAAHNLKMLPLGVEMAKDYKDAYVTRVVNELK